MKFSRVLTYCVIALFAVGITSCHSSKKVGKNDKVIAELIKHSDSMPATKLQHDIVDEAMSWIGTPYAYAKSDKGEGTDCSGLVLAVYEKIAKVKIPRNSAKQADFCTELRPDEVSIGDLVFFATGSDPDRISHVGIMVDEVNFIHASVKKGVVISRIDTPYYIRTFKKFGRISSLN